MEIRRAALISAMGRYSKVVLTVIVTAILARLISANDYGIVAVITVFSTFFTTLSDMGFGAAIIQKRSLQKEEIDDIFSFTVYISLFLTVTFCLFSYLIAEFYDNEIYVSLGQLLSLALFFNAINMVPNGILNRDKKFISIAVRTIVAYAISAILAVILAYYGWRYYAVVMQNIIAAFVTFLWNFSTTRPKFKLKFKMDSISKVLNYSSYQMAFNVVNYFSRNLDNLLTGKFLGNKELGYYNKAYELMLYPVNNLTGVVSPVLHPILSEYQDDYQIIYKKYIKVLKVLMMLAVFISPFCVLSAKEIVDVFYGKNWIGSVDCFRLLSMAILPQMINSSAGSVFQALGKTKLLFINSCLNTIITVVAILLGVLYGKSIVILSLCVSLAYILHSITAFTMLIKWGFNYKLSLFLQDIRKEILAFLILIIAIKIYPFDFSITIISILAKGIYLLFIYMILLLVTKEYKLFV